MKILGMKLVTGEEIIANVDSDSSTLKIAKPRVLHVVQVAPGELGMRLVPWLYSAPDITTTLDPTDVVGAPWEPETQVQEAYLRQTSEIDLSTVGSKQIVTG